MTINNANSCVYSEAQDIWTTCFGDTKQYAGFLFEHLLNPDYVMTYSTEEGKPVSMLCFHPFTLTTPGRNFKAVYIFGVATLPQWRKRGLSTSLFVEAENRFKEREIEASVLVPASDRLFDFYARLGYETAFSAKKTCYLARDISRHSSTDCLITPASLESWIRQRNEFFDDRTLFVKWDEEYLAYIERETLALGGHVWLISCGNQQGHVVCYPYKETVIVKEMTVHDDLIEHVITALHQKYDANEYRLHLPSDASEFIAGDITPFAMVKWYAKGESEFSGQSGSKNAYIAHVLDGPTLGVPLNIT